MLIHLELHFTFSVNFIINFQLTLQIEMIISFSLMKFYREEIPKKFWTDL